jgi:hypothetical protein
MKVMRLNPIEWKDFSAQAHVVCFDEVRPPDLDRIDFALIAGDESGPVAYMTCRELDAESVYMQYGGAFPESRGTVKSFKGYTLMIAELAKNYVRASTLIENKNSPMLKFASKVGLIIIGMRTFKNQILLEHAVEFTEV